LVVVLGCVTYAGRRHVNLCAKKINIKADPSDAVTVCAASAVLTETMSCRGDSFPGKVAKIRVVGAAGTYPALAFGIARDVVTPIKVNSEAF
jgi:hypothetical protein